ncbi:MAG: lipopolysaccharide biosynthesis protein, partial [Thermoplasmata archaeon]
MDETRNRMVEFVGRAWDQVKSPLYRNAFFIMLSSIIGNALGLFFWIVAFRFYNLTDAGFALTMVNTVAFLTGVASLGLPIAIIRFLPESDGQRSLVNTALTIAGGLSAAIAFVFILGIQWWAPGLVVVFGRIEYIPIVVVTAMAYAFGPILDESAIAMRRADLSMWRTVTFALVKIPLPVLFAIWFGTTLGGTLGIYASWSIAYGLSVLIAAFLFLPRAIPGYRPGPRFSRKRLRPMFAFSMGNWAASLVGSAGALLLPL